MKTIPCSLITSTAVLCMLCSLLKADSLEQNFTHPPDSARPWVYWFWNNGAVTREGITADLEAMHRVGIGGVIIMDVVERFAPPAGTAEFMKKEWRDDLQFAVTQAARLGLEINMTNGPGWCGSSGPWITPEMSMQHLVLAQTTIDGPQHYTAQIARADVADKNNPDHFNSYVPTGGYYRDVAVLAFPMSDTHVIRQSSILNLSAKMDASGKLDWDVPFGKWIVQRYGHASTGSSTRPPVLGGNGLECDKLNAKAMDLHFDAMMGKLLDAAGPLAGKSLTATHIDSWEVGTQDWTDSFALEFKKRRGYDPVTFLPELYVQDPAAPSHWEIDSKDMGDRFRWDFYQTVSELLAQNYTGEIAKLAHQHGLRFTLEGYNLPFADEALYTAAADEPMTEFWTPDKNASTEGAAKARQMASVAHVYGHPIVGAESFTSGDNEQWKLHPAAIKALGDFEFSEGVNRFIIHRYAHQPWLNRALAQPWAHGAFTTNALTPGGKCPPHGTNISPAANGCFARENTWPISCTCVRNIRIKHTSHPTPHHPLDTGTMKSAPQALIERVFVKDGNLVLPDGMSYRMLVMPTQTRVITPELAKKIQDLVQTGAVVYGQSPTHAPGLQNFPACDDTVAKMATQVWAGADGKSATEHSFGSGKVFNGVSIGEVLSKLKIDPDFTASVPMNWTHRHLEDAEVYFIANPSDAPVTVDCKFRNTSMQAQRWDPQTGKFFSLDPHFHLQLDPSESDFIVFRNAPAVAGQLTQPIGTTKPLMDLSTDWEVAFAPELGCRRYGQL